MTADMLDLYERASEWTLGKVSGATAKLDAQTPCDEWRVRELMDHMLDTENYFIGSAQGKDVSRPSPNPPKLMSDDPVADFKRARDDMLATFRREGVIEKTGPSLGIAFADQLIHGWDLAKATGQDATMPSGLGEAAYGMLHGRLTDDQRKGAFKPELKVADDASAQDKLLAYTGRDPRG
jgi:uncharacterized protein (TIGR03086 family)